MVSIIIVSYNTKDLLSSCLESLYKTIKSEAFEIIVVDNASTDGSVEKIKNQKSKIKNSDQILKIVKNNENLGFSKGCNIGAQHAKGEYILFLNSDTRLLKDSLSEMIEYFEKNPHTAVLGGMLMNKNHTPQRSAGKFYGVAQVFSLAFGRERVHPFQYDPKIQQEVDWVSGGFMMVRKNVFEEVGGFDEKIFMYIEDMEFCYRVKKLGANIVYFPEAGAIHVGQGSSNRTFAVVQIYRGLLYFYKKHKNPAEYLLIKSILTLKAVAALSFGFATGNAYLKKTYSQALKV